MNAGQLLILIRVTIDKLISMNLLKLDGTFVAPSIEQDTELASFIEQQLISLGVPIPDRVVKITGILPLILGMIK